MKPLKATRQQLRLDKANATICHEKRGILWRCDKCKQTFGAAEVVLELEPNNVEIGFSSMAGFPRAEKYNGKKYRYCCPKCNEVHLFGFDRV